MGALILLLATVLVGELLRRAFFAGAPAPDAPAPVLRTVEAGLPPGARIADLVATQHYVVIHAVMPDGEVRLLVLDPQAGSVRAATSEAPPSAAGEPSLAR